MCYIIVRLFLEAYLLKLDNYYITTLETHTHDDFSCSTRYIYTNASFGGRQTVNLVRTFVQTDLSELLCLSANLRWL